MYMVKTLYTVTSFDYTSFIIEVTSLTNTVKPLSKTDHSGQTNLSLDIFVDI